MTPCETKRTIIQINRHLVELSLRLYIAELDDDTYLAQAIRAEAATLVAEATRLKAEYQRMVAEDRATVRAVEMWLGCEVSG